MVIGYLIAVVTDPVLRHKQHPGAEELKLAVLNLQHKDQDVSPQLREYLKGRIYTLLAYGIKDEWVDGRIDYGRIDRRILGDISVVKGGENDDELYEAAMKIAGKTPSPILHNKTTEQVVTPNGP
jgi:hypothetical protein